MIFVTVNATHASSLLEELEFGTALTGAAYIAVQEMKLDGNGIDVATKWANAG